MKTRIICILSLLMAIMPFTSQAQTNIRKAFDKLIQNGDVTLSESHSKEKDTDTGIKQSQSDIYNFTLPAKKINLVENILKAFRDDDRLAYSTSSGLTVAGDRNIVLAVGDDSAGGVQVTRPGRNYVYACFLAPEKENPSGNYRYAYAMNWEENSGEINGTLIVTYATTLKYRQSVSSGKSFKILNSGSTIEYTANGHSFMKSWFTTFMGYVQMMSTENRQARQAIAAKIYEHCKNSSDVSAEDKNTARELIKGMISEYNDNVIRQLLNASLVNLK